MSIIKLMNKNLLIGIVVVLVLIGGYMLFANRQQQPAAPQTETTEASPSATIAEVMVTLSEQNSSGEEGTAILMEADGKVKVTLELTGAPEGVAQPAHIHVGSCPDVGAVKYPLTSVMDGMSETTLDVTLEQLRGELPLGINVHKSGTEASVYVSCGDLNL